jgi:hypothetical protein
MARNFKEVAHLRTDLQKYGEQYDRIFSVEKKEENKVVEINIKDIARKAYQELGSGQDTEGFPESSSFIYGFCKGYEEAKK